MELEKGLKKYEIKEILIVDDTTQNLDAAKKYFSNIKVEMDYASSAQEAIKKIKNSEKGYNLIMTDLEMETPKAGLEVVKLALEKSGYVTIVTGKNYDKPETDPHHGPNTNIIPIGSSIKGKKELPEIWGNCLEESLRYIESVQGIYDAEKRHIKYVGKPSEQFKSFMMQNYEF